MLMQFTVENYRSFAAPVTLNLSATGDKKHAAHVVTKAAPGAPGILRAAALYGANGAGKSNLVKALAFVKRMVSTRLAVGVRLSSVTGADNADAFRLWDAGTPSRFTLQCIAGGVTYEYTLAMAGRTVENEKLVYAPKGRDALLYERNGQEFTFGEKLKEAEPIRGYLDLIAAATSPERTFLSRASRDNAERSLLPFAPLLRWFRALTIREGGALLSSREEMLADRLEDDEPFRDFVLTLLNGAGVQIDGIGVEVIEREMPRRGTGGEIETRTYNSPQLRLLRNDNAGKAVPFAPDDESDGTRHLLGLADALYNLSQTGGTLVVDELGRSMHSLMAQNMVRLVTERTHTDGTGLPSQMIFTTHDTNLLDLDLLRRDEIWFIEKQPDGASTLYSLAEFKVRPDLDAERGYLNGRFGAIPFAGDWHRLADNPGEIVPVSPGKEAGDAPSQSA